MRNILTYGCLLLMISCVTSKVTSKKDAKFNQKIKNVFITIKGAESSEKFIESFSEKLSFALKEQGIKTTMKYIDPLSLDTEDEINSEIKSSGASLVMVINQTEARQQLQGNTFNIGTNYTGGTFDIQIFKIESKDPVWRGSLNADGSFGLKSAANKATNTLIEKLKEDRLI